MLLPEKLAEFHGYLQERRRVQERKEAGEPAPWTDDPHLQSKFFCCVERDDDRTSRAARAIIQALPAEEQLAPAMFFRLVNRAETLQAILSSGARTSAEVHDVLAGLEVVFNTIAYRVQVKGGLWNLPTVSRMIARSWKVVREDWKPRKTAQYTCDALRGALELGPFIAYQAMQDIRWTNHRYEDESTWCFVGPGAVRGLKRMQGTMEAADMDMSSRGRLRNKAADETEQVRLLPLIRELAEQSGLSAFDVEHNLCEYDKLSRLRNKETGGRAYKRGG
jgi:hypothetical protein